MNITSAALISTHAVSPALIRICIPLRSPGVDSTGSCGQGAYRDVSRRSWTGHPSVSDGSTRPGARPTWPSPTRSGAAPGRGRRGRRGRGSPGRSDRRATPARRSRRARPGGMPGRLEHDGGLPVRAPHDLERRGALLARIECEQRVQLGSPPASRRRPPRVDRLPFGACARRRVDAAPRVEDARDLRARPSRRARGRRRRRWRRPPPPAAGGCVAPRRTASSLDDVAFHGVDGAADLFEVGDRAVEVFLRAR